MKQKRSSEKRPENSMNKPKIFKRKDCPLKAIPDLEITYKNIKLLSSFTSERGRILPRRITSVSAKKQRLLKKAIKQARILALMPYVQQ